VVSGGWGDTEVADEIRDAHQRTLMEADGPELCRWAQRHHIVGGGRQHWRRRGDKDEAGRVHLADGGGL